MTAPINFTEVNGLRVAEARYAHPNGDPILMLHGWGADISLMQPLAERLAPLGYAIYLIDLPGFGQSPPPPTAWSVYDYAAFVVAYLDSRELHCVHLIGHSFGGRLGLILGADYPGRIEKLVLIDSAGVPPKRPVGAQARLALYKAVRDTLYKVGAKGLADRLRAWYGKRYGSADYQNVSGVMRETFVKVVNENLLPHAARIPRPTLLVWGEADEDTPLWQGQRLEKTIPDAGLVTFPGAGHYSYLQHLGETTRILDHFFKH